MTSKRNSLLCGWLEAMYGFLESLSNSSDSKARFRPRRGGVCIFHTKYCASRLLVPGASVNAVHTAVVSIPGKTAHSSLSLGITHPAWIKLYLCSGPYYHFRQPLFDSTFLPFRLDLINNKYSQPQDLSKCVALPDIVSEPHAMPQKTFMVALLSRSLSWFQAP